MAVDRIVGIGCSLVVVGSIEHTDRIVVVVRIRLLQTVLQERIQKLLG